MSYNRVIPRDLFNEAKLLKCLGQLALIAHDGRDTKGNHEAASKIRAEHEGEEFDISQDSNTGNLFCNSITFYAGEKVLIVETTYNSKRPYPLVLDRSGDHDEIDVFEDDGTLTTEFVEYVREQ